MGVLSPYSRRRRISRPKQDPGCPTPPNFLCSFVGSLNFMRLSLKKGAHAVLSRAAYRKFGASRSFFARCGIPRLFAPDIFTTTTLSAACLAPAMAHPTRNARPQTILGSSRHANQLILFGIQPDTSEAVTLVA